ncbi:protein kinase [Clostridium paraputrificum]|uniref:protein kinase n=1 Tax=Clostridium TaxID=1485 RepID=UPI003D34B374
MKRYHCYSACFDEKTEELFRKAKFLGQGNNGVVYSLPEHKVIKIFVEEKVCSDEGYTLLRARSSKFFPKIYKSGKLYIVREMVEGIQLDKYIKKHGMNKELTKNICKIIKEFKSLQFSKLDTRCKDLYVGDNNTIMLIDPKKCFKRKVNFPRHLMKGFLKLGVLDEFLSYVKEIDKKKAREWKNKFDKYWEKERLKEKYLRDNDDDYL